MREGFCSDENLLCCNVLSPVCSFYSCVNLTVHELLRVYGIGAYNMIYTMCMLCLMWNFRMMSTLLQDILVVIKNQKI